jgi:hypothetical protein
MESKNYKKAKSLYKLCLAFSMKMLNHPCAGVLVIVHMLDTILDACTCLLTKQLNRSLFTFLKLWLMMLGDNYSTDPWYLVCLVEVAIRRSFVYMLN